MGLGKRTTKQTIVSVLANFQPGFSLSTLLTDLGIVKYAKRKVLYFYENKSEDYSIYSSLH